MSCALRHRASPAGVTVTGTGSLRYLRIASKPSGIASDSEPQEGKEKAQDNITYHFSLPTSRQLANAASSPVLRAATATVKFLSF